MQQAPEYRDQDQLRREYTPQQPTPAYQGGPADAPVASSRQAGRANAAAASDRVGPGSWSDWVRWGPIWSGFFAIVSTLAVLGALGTAIALTVWRTTPNTAFGYGWSILTGIIAFFLGGWITARAAGVGGSGPAMLNAGLTWALSLVAILVIAIFGAGSAFGFIGGNLSVLLRGGPGLSAGSLAQTAWITFASLVIGLILAMIGGLVGARRLAALRGTHVPGQREQRAV
ncbi:MAG TPA: hypothetical protein VKT82_19040 [Ktedonobacterales bacterium]|nr:hypothetical protein [Ktedonobacterales bacterium]